MGREALKAMERGLKEALGIGSSGTKRFGGGLFSVEMSLKAQPARAVRRPFEDEVQRGIICPHCGLDHSVFGLAIWCADCGTDIFMTHVEAEYGVIHTMLGDVERRGELFGPRIAARDLENCLEDTVSIFEAVLKTFVRRHLRAKEMSEEDVHEFMTKRIRNVFQSPRRSVEVTKEYLGHGLFEGWSDDDLHALESIFEKRHPITHNLGVIDRKYLERAQQAEKEGRDIRVTRDEILQAIEQILSALHALHTKVFSS
jgi:hypothetical protein